MNESTCQMAMSWFRENIFFSRDYTDIPAQLIEYSEKPDMLSVIKKYAENADVGIQDMDFEFRNEEINEPADTGDIPTGIIAALTQFAKALSDI